MPANIVATASLRLDALEIARGHDGLLRGQPEPVVIIGLLTAGGGTTTLRARQVIRFAPPERVPCVLTPSRAVRLSTTVYEPMTTLAVLLMAVEEDSGSCISMLYGALERPRAIAYWCDGDSVPDPVHVGQGAPNAQPSAVHLMVNERSIEPLEDDDLVGCALWHLSTTKRWVGDARASFQSRDLRNDWTARFKLWLRPHNAPAR